MAWAPGLVGQNPVPDERWYTFDTPNFRVIHPEALEDVARRAAERGERALERLDGFGARPDLIRMVVTDHVDFSNGLATAMPYPRIVLWARPPMDGPGPIPFDDWLELLVTHELVHILHLEMTGELGRASRRLMGRAPLLWPNFPAFLLPRWAIEGVAVEAESALTDGGRGHGTRLEGTVRAAALEGRLERLDQVMGESPIFPGGDRPYVYGSLFFDEMSEAHGREAVADFFERQATRLNPFRLDQSAREAFGRSLTELHGEWMQGRIDEAENLRSAVEARDLAPRPRLLTRGGRQAFHPRFDGETLYHTRADGRSAPVLVRDGEVLRTLNVAGSLAPDGEGGVFLLQPEYIDRYRIRSDLWWIGPDGSREVRTRGLRAAAFDVKGDRIVAVLDGEGTHRLVLLDDRGTILETLREADPGVHYGSPRWSPDGERIAISRWSAGGLWEIVVLAPEGEVVLDRGRAPASAPTWTPDGEWVLWVSERSGVANVYGARDGGPLLQFTDLLTAAAFPEVSPDGTRLVFSLLGGDGWDLAEIPFQKGFEPLPVDDRYRGEPGRMVEGHRAAIQGESRPWSPLESLRPRYVLPHIAPREFLGDQQVLPLVLGLHSEATDPVGRNRWEVGIGAPVESGVSRWEGYAGWEWAGLGNPVLRGRVDQRWVTLGRAGEILVVARERMAGIRAEGVQPGLRASRSATLEIRGVRQDWAYLREDGEPVEGPPIRRDFAEGTMTLGMTRVRSYPLGVGPTEGVALQGRLRARRPLGGEGGFDEMVGIARGFLPVGVSVASVRIAGGGARGPGARSGHFGIGGVGGSAGPLFPVRGVVRGARGGTRAWGVTGEVRTPLARLHRGWGVLPLHLDQLAGALFVDAAAVDDVVASVGVELSLVQTPLFWSTERVRAGLAVPISGERGIGAYAALGWSF